MTQTRIAEQLLDILVEDLDIPESLYEQAAERYQAIGVWLNRADSALRAYSPEVYSQGSFRIGTAVNPIDADQGYDLDFVCALGLPKTTQTQHQVKNSVGTEIRGYAAAHGIQAPVDEKKRCWRLDYADHVNFHVDVLPALPDDRDFVESLISVGVAPSLAEHTVAITDNTDANYDILTADWPRSNPRGFALWFESVMRPAALQYLRSLVTTGAYREVEDIPAYRWKTPLQHVIQILKRHRDVMFAKDPDLGPISMIITTLAARAYGNQQDLLSALQEVVTSMPDHIQNSRPFVPNPVNPAEDFADAWEKNPDLRQAFAHWHQQLLADVDRLLQLRETEAASRFFLEAFALTLDAKRARRILASSVAPKAGKSRTGAETVRIPSSAPRPWNSYDT